MKFNDPEVVEMGSAGDLITITMLQNTREDVSQPEPTFNVGAIYVSDEE